MSAGKPAPWADDWRGICPHILLSGLWSWARAWNGFARRVLGLMV